MGLCFTRKKKFSGEKKYFESVDSSFGRIFEIRDNDLYFLANQRKPIAIYSAAGKEIVFGYTLSQSELGEILAIDDDSNRHCLFMDASGIMVSPPQAALSVLERGSNIVVMNPSHLSKATKIYEHKFNVLCVGKLG